MYKSINWKTLILLICNQSLTTVNLTLRQCCMFLSDARCVIEYKQGRTVWDHNHPQSHFHVITILLLLLLLLCDTMYGKTKLLLNLIYTVVHTVQGLHTSWMNYMWPAVDNIHKFNTSKYTYSWSNITLIQVNFAQFNHYPSTEVLAFKNTFI